MGEEWGSRTPFLYFTDHKAGLASNVAAGRRQEFAHFSALADPEARARIPDPNDPISFHHSVPDRCDVYRSEHAEWQSGRASARERVCQDRLFPVVVGSSNNKTEYTSDMLV